VTFLKPYVHVDLLHEKHGHAFYSKNLVGERPCTNTALGDALFLLDSSAGRSFMKLYHASIEGWLWWQFRPGEGHSMSFIL
jgi:hypothetical protein